MKHDVDGVQLYYETHGDVGDNGRPWIVFSHSLACTVRMWDPQIHEFSKSYRVLLFDTRGHGNSDCPPGPYTMDAIARDAWQLLRGLGIDQAHFVGLSMGGMIGQTLAIEHPEAFASLTLADTTSAWPQGTAEMFAERVSQAEDHGMASLVDATLGRWFTAGFREACPDKVAAVGNMIANTPVAGYAGCSHAIPRINLTHRLNRITCPSLVIVGNQDAGTPPEMAREIHEHLPGSEFVEIASASHLSNIEQADVFNQELSSFLARSAATEQPA